MVKPALTIALLLGSDELIAVCRHWLPSNRYRLVELPGVNKGNLVKVLASQREGVDAIIVDPSLLDDRARDDLQHEGLLFPAVVVGDLVGRVDYHSEEVHLPVDQLEQLGYNVDAAISCFLRHGQREGRRENNKPYSENSPAQPKTWHLASRLQERLGCLGVFYKRDPARFLTNLAADEQRELLQSLKRTYRDLLISYFHDPAAANQALESFVNTSFFGNLPITRIVEIHIDLIDEFHKQLSLEGHKDNFLQDYRLALLDVMAHLCEMYRRSMPPDLPLGRGSSLRHLSS